MYALQFLPPAERYLKKVRDKALFQRFRSAFVMLGDDPYIGQPKHGNLAGIYGLDVYHKGTNYEIAYRIYEHDEKRVIVILAGTRENFYKELGRMV